MGERGIVCGYTYDIYGNTTGITVGEGVSAPVNTVGNAIASSEITSPTLVNYVYNPNNGKLDTLIYGNGDKVKYVYDQIDRLSEIQYNSVDENGNESFETAYRYTYDKSGNISKIQDMSKNQSVVNKYDSSGNLTKSVTYSGTNDIISSLSLSYDDQSRVINSGFSMETLSPNDVIGYVDVYQGYSYMPASLLGQVTTTYQALRSVMTPTYDTLYRTKNRSTSVSVGGTDKLTFSTQYTYETTGSETGGLISSTVSSITVAGATSPVSTATYSYTYDENGNITEIRDESGEIQYRYEYDEKGQLIREDNRPTNRTHTRYYDSFGNVISRSSYHFTLENQPDREDIILTRDYSYNSANGRMIRHKSQKVYYDGAGNPTRYCMRLMEWDNGRQLVKLTRTANNIPYTYTYNADGIRIGKEGN